VGLVQLTGQSLQLRLGEQRTVGVVGRAHLVADRPAQVLRELVLNVPDLVQLTPSDDRVVEDVHDGFAQGAAAIEYDQDRPGDVQSAVAGRRADPLSGWRSRSSPPPAPADVWWLIAFEGLPGVGVSVAG